MAGIYFSDKVLEFVEQEWKRRQKLENPVLFKESVRDLPKAGQVLAGFLFASLPESDLSQYSFETFRQDLIHSLDLREQVAWCRELPEEVFLHYVFFPRINTEELSPCRTFFYQQLIPRIQGLSLKEAILEINYWCGEHVTYQASDQRTLSAMAVFQAGLGRCGEESVFTVNALRSVGIAARQVYVPWWSHCDDNHAWVEVYVDGDWHYLGACEPEEILDRGWFTYAASRAMLVKSRTFGHYPLPSEEWICREGNVDYCNSTSRYADTVWLSIRVENEQGDIQQGIPVSLSVVNMASYRVLAVLHTDQQGETGLRLGQGSVLLEASCGDFYGAQLVDTVQLQKVTLVLQHPLTQPKEERFTFLAPKDGNKRAIPLTDQQRQTRLDRIRQAARLRSVYNRPQCPDNDFFRELSEKDHLDFPVDSVCQYEMRNERELPHNLFAAYVQNPRVDCEVLRPMRKELRSWEQEKGIVSMNGFEPQRAYDAMKTSWQDDYQDSYDALEPCAAAICKMNNVRPWDRQRFLINLTRMNQIPARRNPVTQLPEYWEEGWYPFDQNQRKTGTLILATDDKAAFREDMDFGLASLTENGRIPCHVGQQVTCETQAAFELPEGLYELLVTFRLPDGNQNVWAHEIRIIPFTTQRIWLQRQEPQILDLVVNYELQDVLLQTEKGESMLSELVKERCLLAILQPGAEPTQHVLTELKDCHIPVILATGDGESLARRMYVNPENLPLLLIVEPGLKGRYACSGYRVGSVALCEKLFARLEECS